MKSRFYVTGGDTCLISGCCFLMAPLQLCRVPWHANRCADDRRRGTEEVRSIPPRPCLYHHHGDESFQTLRLQISEPFLSACFRIRKGSSWRKLFAVPLSPCQINNGKAGGMKMSSSFTSCVSVLMRALVPRCPTSSVHQLSGSNLVAGD